MKSLITRNTALAVLAVLASALLASCGSSQAGSTPSADGKVTIEVSMDQGLEKGAIDAFKARVTQFEAANPKITVTPKEYTWTGTTFAAELAGGTLPDVFPIPFTDGRGLIERKQIANLSTLIADLPYAKKFNPNVAQAGEDAKGSMWAIPIAAYGQGLHYNRTLFTKAGLDPDKPPTTWAEVRADAKAIADKTGQAGYAEMTAGNTGGWILTTLVNAEGGRVEKGSGDKVTATIDSPEMVKVLTYLKSLRWDDNSMGANFLYDWGTINQDFAAGKIGMYVSGGGNYGNLFTQNGLKPADYGVTVLPLQGSDAGVLGGGTLAAVSAKASPAEQAASVKWIDFYYIQKLADKDAAILDAKTTAASGQPVGAPQLPVFDQATYDASQVWIKDLINVPVDQMKPFTEGIFKQKLIPEPAGSTQELYGALDPVVQAVLTDKNANIDKLLSDAQVTVQSILDKS
jgi:multiple sugar transport system substrate-binding protein